MFPRILLIVTLLGGCAANEPVEVPDAIASPEIHAMQNVRIFFGHESVGRNILAGLAEVAPDLQVVSLSELSSTTGYGLVEASIGQNGDPGSKDRAFLEAVARMGPGDVALYKYCYLDMDADTNPDSLYAAYSRTLEAAAERGIRVLPVTMPVTTVAPLWKRWVKQVLGKTTDLELSAKRQQFNQRVRENFPPDAIVDLARMESSLEDGTRSMTSFRGDEVEILASEFTDDGAHLNERGRRQVATLFVGALERAISAGN